MENQTEYDTPRLETLKAKHIERLLHHYGPLIGGQDLLKALGFASPDALTKAEQRGHLPFPVFKQSGRRGWWARIDDMATWLSEIDLVIEKTKRTGEET